MTFIRINLATLSPDDEPGPLPAELVGLDLASLADLPAAIDPVPSQFEGVGYWPVVEADLDAPEVDAEGRRYLVPPPPPPPIQPEAVTAERDRRMDAGLSFAGHRYQSRPGDRENIAGAAQLAFMAIVNGAGGSGDLRWADADNDFVWIAEDNSLVPMDAPTVIAFAKAAAGYKQALTMTARAIKDMDPIPASFADDALWPG
jgi:hypothetical protein